MPETLSAVWQQIEKMIADGLSVIPVRDKEQIWNGRLYTVKSAYSWKKYLTIRITKDELWYAMTEKYNTTAVGIIGGAISGGLEIIDIDVKWFPGIDARVFKDIETFYPDLFPKLRIHQSPSGGYHILYRVADFIIPGNGKLARRPATEDELKINPKEKWKCFLETRGEGGYVVAPPSLGYTIHADNPIPVISANERESIINICRNYNQEIKKDTYTAPLKKYYDYYSTDPFEHFNQSQEAETILERNGWTQLGRHGNHIHYTKPGGSSKTIHASFIINYRVYYIFTTGTDFPVEPDGPDHPGTGFMPATALAILEFNGDKSKTYQYLVSNGYGIIKPVIEERIVKNKALQGKPLPPNMSLSAIAAHKNIVKQLDEQHPYGTFWELDDEGSVVLSREGIYRVAEGLGFRYYKQEVVRVIGFFIYKQDERAFYDAVKDYIQEEDADLYEKICNTYESFIQRNGAFSITRLQLLDQSSIISDTQQTAYKFYLNGYVFITSERYTLNPYENIAGLIWQDQIQQRNFIPAEIPAGVYPSFLDLACGDTSYTRSIIGYLTHQYKDERTAYIIVITEECSDPKQGGGSGKNIFGKLLSYTTSYKSIPGGQVRFDERFMQAWNGERIFCLSDVPKRFDFTFLKEMSAGSGLLKKLFKNEEAIPVQDMPKFIVLTNYSYEVADGGLKRRIIPLEFTDFFTKCGGVDVHFNAHFPNDWTTDDWIGYDNYICQSIQCWLVSGRKLAAPDLTTGGWLKQYDQSYGQLTKDFIEVNWPLWVKQTFVSLDEFNNTYDTFCRENKVTVKYQLSSIKMNWALADWAKHMGGNFISRGLKWDGVENIRGKEFYDKAPF